MSERRLPTPIPRDARLSLALGDTVFLTGEIVATAGYPTHQRIVEHLDAGRTLRVLERRTQAADHPILLTVPETLYLKCLILETVA